MNDETKTDAYGLPTLAQIDSGEVGVRPPVPKSTKKETLINRTVVKRYALGISAKCKAGKFTRVSESFYIGVEAELDSKIRQLVIQDSNPPEHGGLKFTTKLAREKAVERIEKLAARIIYGKVIRHPSVGVTLKD